MNKLYDLKKKAIALKNQVSGVPPIVAQVKEATNLEKWGASGTLLQEICRATYRHDE
jgi:hypothetical protein